MSECECVVIAQRESYANLNICDGVDNGIWNKFLVFFKVLITIRK